MSATLAHLTRPLDRWLNDPAVEDVAIQKPGEAWVFSHGAWVNHPADMGAGDIEDLLIVAAAQRRQDINHDRPLLTIDLNQELRLAGIIYPCVAEDRPALSIRRGSDEWPVLANLTATGLFSNTRTRPPKFENPDLVAMLKEARAVTDPEEHGQRIESFLRAAVQRGMNIILAGNNAAGKTYVAKSLIGEIPLHKRIITIQDAEELKGMPHPNWVSLYQSPTVTQAQLVQIGLRFRIEVLFLQEIREGEAAIALLHGMQGGHRGAITTIHASDCNAVFTRLAFLIKSTPGGAMIDGKDIDAELRSLIDIVIHCSRPGRFAVDEILFKEAEE